MNSKEKNEGYHKGHENKHPALCNLSYYLLGCCHPADWDGDWQRPRAASEVQQ